MLSSVHHYYLVLYTDTHNHPYFYSKYGNNSNIKIVIKPIEDFIGYKYRDFWTENHDKNNLLNQKINWELNMLWSEKVHFVHQTLISNYFPKTEYYGWIDIGYFRCRPQLDIKRELLLEFPNQEKLQLLDKTKIHYALVNTNTQYINHLIQIIKNNATIPPDQISIGGGCFIGDASKIEWWKNTFANKLEHYIDQKQLVKDDQIIIVDCIFNDFLKGNNNFELHQSNNRENLDPWFLFSRILL
jgi:hypothetical protein